MKVSMLECMWQKDKARPPKRKRHIAIFVSAAILSGILQKISESQRVIFAIGEKAALVMGLIGVFIEFAIIVVLFLLVSMFFYRMRTVKILPEPEPPPEKNRAIKCPNCSASVCMEEGKETFCEFCKSALK